MYLHLNDDDTKNTAGTSNSTSKLYLCGGTSQSSSGVVTYSNSNCYASGGYLYSNNTKVSVEGHTHSGYLTSSDININTSNNYFGPNAYITIKSKIIIQYGIYQHDSTSGSVSPDSITYNYLTNFKNINSDGPSLHGGQSVVLFINPVANVSGNRNFYCYAYYNYFKLSIMGNVGTGAPEAGTVFSWLAIGEKP